MIDDHTFGVDDPDQQSRLSRWYQHHRPALVATAWFWLLFFILALITLVTGWASLPVTMSLQVLVSFGAGYVAAKTHHKEDPQSPNYARLGALTGLYLPFTTLIVIILVALWIGISSFGTLIPLMIPYFLFFPLLLVASAALAFLGARMAQYFLERKLKK
jgi:polyferredoxin